MKLQFVSQSKNVAEKFAEHIKTERSLSSTITEKDKVYTVEYSIADYCQKDAACCEPKPICQEDLSQLAGYIFREMQYQNNWLLGIITSLENAFYNHITRGHLPPIEGPEKMEKAIEALGISGDYKVEKRVVWASEMEFDITK